MKNMKHSGGSPPPFIFSVRPRYTRRDVWSIQIQSKFSPTWYVP